MEESVFNEKRWRTRQEIVDLSKCEGGARGGGSKESPSLFAILIVTVRDDLLEVVREGRHVEKNKVNTVSCVI